MTAPYGYLTDSLGQPLKTGVFTKEQIAAGAIAVVANTPTGMVGGDGAAVTGAGAGGIAAPATLDSSSAVYNNATLFLAASNTLTVAAGALSILSGGVSILVGQSGTATLAFSGGAVKENATGTSSSNVTLSASGIYALLPSPSGSDKWRLSGGAST